MDSELLIIFPSIIVMLVVIGLSVNGIVSKILNHRREMRVMERQSRGAGAANLASRTEMIEERLAVLERLATDKGTLLSDEIEALRLDVSERREKETSQ